MGSEGRRRLMASVALVGAALLVNGCGENRAFERESAQLQGSKLLVPTSLTPPIFVEPVSGAPREWELPEKMAEALRSRDIPASAKVAGRSSYILKGALKDSRGDARAPNRVTVLWQLYDPAGKKVGETTQIAAVPALAKRGANDGVVEAMADAAAESIAPIVPSSAIALADASETGEPRGNERAASEARNPVTAIGKMGTGTSGVSKNLLERPASAEKLPEPGKPGEKPETAAAKAPETKVAKGPVAAPPKSDPKAVTAIGRMGTGASPLSRNLMREGGAPPRESAQPAPGTARPPTPKPAGPTVARTEAPKTAPARPPLAAPPVAAPPVAAPAARPSTEMFLDEPMGEPVPARAPAPEVRPPAGPPSAPPASLPMSEAPKPAPAFGRRQMAGADAPAGGRAMGARRAAPQTHYWVQVGALDTADRAQAVLAALRRSEFGAVGVAGERIAVLTAARGQPLYRALFGPFVERAAADESCGKLRAKRRDCFVAGEPVPLRPHGLPPGAPKHVPAPMVSLPIPGPVVYVARGDKPGAVALAETVTVPLIVEEAPRFTAPSLAGLPD
jgi:hypothetical protein